MGGSFGGMMMRHADRMHGRTFSSTNDPDYAAPARKRKPHPDVVEAEVELKRIKTAYSKARNAAVFEFREGYLPIEDDLIKAKVITGLESIRTLCQIGQTVNSNIN
ncbi:hypothetical protein D3C85_527990 [compost metagenome]